jgi:hypothetical protein
MCMTIHWYDLISIIGVVMILVAYFLLQTEKMNSQGYGYSTLNIVGSSFILYSLSYDWNLSAVIIEICWIIISFIGLWKQILKSRER